MLEFVPGRPRRHGGPFRHRRIGPQQPLRGHVVRRGLATRVELRLQHFYATRKPCEISIDLLNQQINIFTISADDLLAAQPSPSTQPE
jgi:hypothetical protein